MKKLLSVLAAAGLAAGGWAYWSRSQAAKRREGRGRVVEATSGPIEEAVEATGAVAPLNRVEIKPPISGRIEQLLVDEGTVVKTGQILAWMSSTDRAAILDAARAKGPEAVKQWEDAYKATPIIAPLSGVIILKNVVVGQTVEASGVIYAVSDRLIVTGQVDESDIGRVHTGMKARVTLDSYPTKHTEGQVFDILYEGKNVSNVITYGVKVKIDKVPDYFRSQMTANISFIVRKKDNAVLIPATALRETSDGGKTVLLPQGESGAKPESREVKTGIESGENIEIVSGLEAGDKVLISQGKYTPQQGPQASPLTMGARPGGNQGGGGGRRNQ